MSHFQTYISWNSTAIPYTPPRHDYLCTASAVSPAPSQVENLTIIPSFTSDLEVNIYLEWSPPSITNGELMSYDICIGSVPLDLDEDIPSSGEHECSTVQVCSCNPPLSDSMTVCLATCTLICLTYTQLVESTNITEYFPPDRYPLYVQVRL